MTYRVEASVTFARQFREAPQGDNRRIRAALERLREDPSTARPGADVRPLVATDPTKWRLRVGEWRIVYLVDGRTVRVVEMFRRGRGYRA